MVEEKANHLAGCIGPSWIGEGTRGAATGPSMAGSVDVPLLEDRPSFRVVVDGAGVGESSRCLAAAHLRVQPLSDLRVRDHLITVTGMNYGVLIAMEHDGRDNRRAFFTHRDVRAALAHGGERRRKIACYPAREAGVHSNCGVEIGVGFPHNSRGRTSG